MEHLTFKSKQARLEICSLLPRSDERSFRTFLGIYVTEVGAFFLKCTVVTLPVPGSVLVYANL